MPKVSVIVPCYNSAGFIGKCLKGLENQTYRDMDVIVIDDCSTDETVDLILEFQKKSNLNITVLQNEKNNGPAQSRNTGIAASNAVYIAFCDSDDWYEPVFLEAMVRVAEENDADMVFCNFKRVFDSGKVIYCNVIGNAASARSAEDVLAIGVDSLPATMIRRTIITQNALPDIRNGEDMAVLPIFIAASKHFAFVSQCNYNYFYRTGSLSTQKNPAIVFSLMNSFKHVQAHLNDKYSKVCEYIGIRNILYGLVLNAVQCGFHSNNIWEIVTDFEKDYPHWYQNRYMRLLPLRKRFFVYLVHKKRFMLVKTFCLLHTFLLGW